MNKIFFNVILNLFQDLFPEKPRCRNKFGMTRIETRGFTLIELLVSISIIGILAGFLLANFVGIRQRARDGVRKSDLRQIQSALELYRSDKGSYPKTEDFPECGSQLTDGANPPVIYMQKIPCDPLGSPNVYTYKSENETRYDLVACLENDADLQMDNPVKQECSKSNDKSGISYTLQNP